MLETAEYSEVGVIYICDNVIIAIAQPRGFANHDTDSCHDNYSEKSPK